EKRLSLDVTLSSNIPGRVLGDEGRLKQVLLNLVNNAIKFTERGSICIDARWKPADSEESSSYLEVIVQDTGIGISSEDQLKLFQPFTQVDSSSVRRYGGTGLGLSIVKRLCQLMGGDIYLKSESGLGSQFTFKIALKEDLTFVPTETPRNGQTKVSAGGKKSVLVVDDLPVNRKIAHYVLESLGCQVTLANDFEEAMRQLEAYACFDLVFLDIQLPGKDGYQLATEIRSWEKQHRPDGVDPLKLVALTAENPDEIRTKCLESGMDGCLGKPFKKHDFSEFL
ncbi:MAG: ATP-binding protein, partial [Verrucomicrobiota bacterium]